jgi:hypothetical protein
MINTIIHHKTLVPPLPDRFYCSEVYTGQGRLIVAIEELLAEQALARETLRTKLEAADNAVAEDNAMTTKLNEAIAQAAKFGLHLKPHYAGESPKAEPAVAPPSPEPPPFALEAEAPPAPVEKDDAIITRRHVDLGRKVKGTVKRKEGRRVALTSSMRKLITEDGLNSILTSIRNKSPGRRLVDGLPEDGSFTDAHLYGPLGFGFHDLVKFPLPEGVSAKQRQEAFALCIYCALAAPTKATVLHKCGHNGISTLNTGKFVVRKVKAPEYKGHRSYSWLTPNPKAIV